jgi:hypothetical protein
VFKNKQSFLILIFRDKSTVVGFVYRPDGGIGRRAGLKHLWATVRVQVPLRVQKTSEKSGVFYFYNFLYIYKVNRQVQPRSFGAAPGTKALPEGRAFFVYTSVF